ncbi:permease [Tepiditoga spiralis]|uniref:Permease n=1 Tax=Tepiditoga spiralis TaxID=2108365 RepID=A0A7G1G7W1_9BACT|nr:MFS transporter [Tepiditoga spiralis]BBE31294.1 permease [Tepiditoga spiralis]
MTLDALIEKIISKNQRKFMLFITALGWAFVASGIMVLPFTQKMIMNEWHLSRVFATTLSSSTFIGMFLGALIAGLISDFIGRKNASLLFLIIASTFSVLTGFSSNPTLFIIFRIISGFGFGGLLPALNTYLTEFLNTSIRGKYLVLLESSWALGSIMIALFHIIIGRNFGWKYDYMFLSIGLIPFLIILYLPESPKYLLLKNKNKKFEKLFKYTLNEKIIFPKSTKSSIKNLFEKKYLSKTLNVWLLWFVMSFGYYGVFIWFKGILAQKGISIIKTDWYLFYMYLAQLPGYLLAAFLIEKIGRRKSILLFTFGTGISSILFAFANTNVTVLLYSMVVSIFCMGAWGLTYAYTPELYPTSFRGTANGTSGSITRLSGFLAPYYTAYFLEKNNIMIGLIGISLLFFITGTLNYIFLPETLNKEVN